MRATVHSRRLIGGDAPVTAVIAIDGRFIIGAAAWSRLEAFPVDAGSISAQRFVIGENVPRARMIIAAGGREASSCSTACSTLLHRLPTMKL